MNWNKDGVGGGLIMNWIKNGVGGGLIMNWKWSEEDWLWIELKMEWGVDWLWIENGMKRIDYELNKNGVGGGLIMNWIKNGVVREDDSDEVGRGGRMLLMNWIGVERDDESYELNWNRWCFLWIELKWIGFLLWIEMKWREIMLLMNWIGVERDDESYELNWNEMERDNASYELTWSGEGWWVLWIELK